MLSSLHLCSVTQQPMCLAEEPETLQQRRRNPFASANRSPALAKLAAARGMGSKRLAGQPAEELAVQPKRRRKATPAARTPLKQPPADSKPAISSHQACLWLLLLVAATLE